MKIEFDVEKHAAATFRHLLTSVDDYPVMSDAVCNAYAAYLTDVCRAVSKFKDELTYALEKRHQACNTI